MTGSTIRDYSYWHKQNDGALFPDLAWNMPEQKTGRVTVIGGNAQSFANVIKSAEYLAANFPIKSVQILLPESLRLKVPPLPEINFATCTEAGSFAKSSTLDQAATDTDFAIYAGDFSKNSATAVAVTAALKASWQPADGAKEASATPAILARDTVELTAPAMLDLIDRPNTFYLCPMMTLQKVFRAVYYPKMLLLSTPLLSIIETLHKFTLSYPCTITTFHMGQIIVATGGKISTTPIEDTEYSPVTIWSSSLAARIAACNLYTPGKAFEATTYALCNPS